MPEETELPGRRDQENEANDAAARPAFLKLALDASTSLASTIDVVLAEGRLLRVRPGFDADLGVIAEDVQNPTLSHLKER